MIPRSGGIELAMTISEEWFDRLATHRRNMAGRTGCGLCGAENIEQALRKPAAVSNTVSVSQAALQQARFLFGAAGNLERLALVPEIKERIMALINLSSAQARGRPQVSTSLTYHTLCPPCLLPPPPPPLPILPSLLPFMSEQKGW